MTKIQKIRLAVFGGSAVVAGSASAATDYSPLINAITGEQGAIIGVILAVAGVLAAVYAVKRGAGIGLSAVKGR